MSEVKDFKVNLSSVAEPIFGITTRRYRQLAKEKKVHAPVKGQIWFIKATKELVKYYQELARAGGSSALMEEKIRIAKASADKIELMVKKMKGELVETKAVIKVWSNLLVNFRQKLLVLPKKLAPILISYTDVNALEARLEQEIHEALNELREVKPDDFTTSA